MRYNIVENCRYRGKRDLFLSRNYELVVYYLFVYLNDEYASIKGGAINTQTQNKTKAKSKK